MWRLQGLFRALHPLIRIDTHLSCCFCLLLWAECWYPSLCLDNFPQQLKLIITGTFNRVLPASVGSYLALHFFLKVEFNSLSCFLIKNLWGLHFDVFKREFLPKNAYLGFCKCFTCFFHLLIPVGVVNCQTSTAGQTLGPGPLLAPSQTEAGSLHSVGANVLSPSCSFGPSSLPLSLLPGPSSPFWYKNLFLISFPSAPQKFWLWMWPLEKQPAGEGETGE